MQFLGARPTFCEARSAFSAACSRPTGQGGATSSAGTASDKRACRNCGARSRSFRDFTSRFRPAGSRMILALMPRWSAGFTRSCVKRFSTSPNWKRWRANYPARSNWTKRISADGAKASGVAAQPEKRCIWLAGT